MTTSLEANNRQFRIAELALRFEVALEAASSAGIRSLDEEPSCP
jgi:hypothetical protein